MLGFGLFALLAIHPVMSSEIRLIELLAVCLLSSSTRTWNPHRAEVYYSVHCNHRCINWTIGKKDIFHSGCVHSKYKFELKKTLLDSYFTYRSENCLNSMILHLSSCFWSVSSLLFFCFILLNHNIISQGTFSKLVNLASKLNAWFPKAALLLFFD